MRDECEREERRLYERTWLNRITGDRVRNCTEDSLETMMNAKCKFIECKCNRGKEKGGCRCTVHRGVLLVW